MPEEQLPTGLLVHGDRREHDLTFYSLSTCPMCRKGREYLEEKGYAYRLLEVDRLEPEQKDRLKEELARRHGTRVLFPALLIDNTRLVLGFFRGAWDDALGEKAPPDRSAPAARVFAEQVAARRGWQLNPDPRHLTEVLAGLEANRQRHGYYLCPCRDGTGDRNQDADITCPCEYSGADIAEFGHCYCGLFVSSRFAAGGGTVQPIPERRLQRQRERPVAIPTGASTDLCSIKDTVRAIHELERQLKRNHGLTLNEGLCLCCVSNLSHSPGECARQMGVSASRISRILNSLEKKGLLERRSLPGDHRSTSLVVTDKGRTRLDALRRGGFSFSRLEGQAGGPDRKPDPQDRSSDR
ncbi:MAG: MarR family transcriptional regulator [Spirochaetales bacterium]|nr:MarR family transcriptional regulator [Spirochaetales bacterium]